MKAIACLMCLAVVAAKPMFGRYVMTYDNSFENGVWDTSYEWVPAGHAVGAPVSLKSANTADSHLPVHVNADSSEELMFMLGDGTKPVARTRSQQVQDLTRMLNSGYMDNSDEYMLRAVMNNPERFGNRPYYVDYSGEVNFLPHGSNFGVGGSNFGVGGGAAANSAPGSGVEAVKK